MSGKSIVSPQRWSRYPKCEKPEMSQNAATGGEELSVITNPNGWSARWL
jgi:hypothetical protein